MIGISEFIVNREHVVNWDGLQTQVEVVVVYGTLVLIPMIA